MNGSRSISVPFVCFHAFVRSRCDDFDDLIEFRGTGEMSVEIFRRETRTVRFSPDLEEVDGFRWVAVVFRVGDSGSG